MDHSKSRKRKFLSSIAKAAMAAFVAWLVFPVVALAQAAPSGRYVVKLIDASTEPVLRMHGSDVQRLFASAEDSRLGHIYTFASSLDVERLRREMAGSFEYLERDFTLGSSVVVSSDPGYTSDPQNIDKQWALAKAGFTEAWEKTAGSQSNIVAVVDTGIDGTHEDLQFVNFVKGFDFINNKEIQPLTNSDDNGHGTLVAGVLAATANNGRGVVGTNWQVTLMPIKALDSDGKGDSSNIAEAIVWAADNGANIINLSLGGAGFGHDTTLANAVSYAFEKGVVIVAAAGNDSSATGSSLDADPVFPICDDNNSNMVIGVAAVDQYDLKPAFSNYGKNCIDVSAPGKRILSTINHDPFSKAYSPSAYAYASGTSLAVPFVSGQAAILRALYPYATNTQIRDRIISTTDPIDELNMTQCSGASCRGLLGSGRINVMRSVAEPITDARIKEGELVRAEGSDQVYYISGGQKRLVSPFVMNQRFLHQTVRVVPAALLAGLQEGPYATPLDGTLVKLPTDSTVYYISKGVKLGVKYQVFLQRKFAFEAVKTVSYPEFTSWVTGSLLTPAEGTLIKSDRNQTVYWVVGEVLHPINFAYYRDTGLQVFPIVVVSEKDIANFPKGEAFIK